VTVTHLTKIVFLYQQSHRRWLDYWPKRVGEDIINKNT